MTDEQKALIAEVQTVYNSVTYQIRDLDNRSGQIAQYIKLVSQLVSDNEQDIAGMQKQLELYDEYHEDAPAGAGILTTLHIVSGVEANTGSNRQKITDMLQEMKDKRESLTWQYRDLLGQADANDKERGPLYPWRDALSNKILALGGVVVEPTDTQ